MAEAQAEIEFALHPAPHRGKVSLAALTFGLVAAPAAWALQLVVNYSLASHVCFPGYRPLASVANGWGSVWSVLLTIELVALAVAIAGGITAYSSWQATREEAAGETTHLVEAGRGRTRFLALWALFTSLAFSFALLFSLTGLFVVPLCGS
jgi:hypothetical protein